MNHNTDLQGDMIFTSEMIRYYYGCFSVIRIRGTGCYSLKFRSVKSNC
jgi:hypothetical protein